MLKLEVKNNELQQSNWRSEIVDNKNMIFLQERVDLAEKENKNPFHDFSDVEVIQWFLHQRKHLNEKNDRSERTIKEYERELSQFVEHLLQYSKDIDLDIDYIIEASLFKSLQPRHIRRYQEWVATSSPYVLERGSYSAATLARKTTVIKSFLNFLHDVKYIIEPLHTGLRIATVRKDDRPNRDIGPYEVIRLLRYYRDQHHPVAFAIIHVLTTTGIRNEEFCQLTLKDLQYDSILEGYYIDVLGKGNKRRQIPLKTKALNSIKMFRYARGLDDFKEAEPHSPLFTTNTGKAYSPSYLTQYLTKTIEKSELSFLEKRTSRVGPHTFRHAFAIISHLSEVDIYDIMKSLGHEKIETTMIYLEKVFEKERHAIHEWKPEVFGEFM